MAPESRSVRSRLVTCAVLLGLVAVSCAPRSSPGPEHAEIPLLWVLPQIDSVGGIPADEFVFMPSDRVRPTSPASGVPGEEFVATVDSAIAARLLFRQTAFQMATRYSREQQLAFWSDLRVALARRALIDSLWAEREETIRHLEGRLPLGGRREPGQAIRVVSVSEAEVLRSLPLLAWFELKDIALGNPLEQVAPRRFQMDVWSLNWAPRGLLCLPATMMREVSADTSLSLSTRLEFFRLAAWLSPIIETGPGAVAWPDSLMSTAVSRMTPLLETIRSERRLASRYHWLDDPNATGNPMR